MDNDQDGRPHQNPQSPPSPNSRQPVLSNRAVVIGIALGLGVFHLLGGVKFIHQSYSELRDFWSGDDADDGFEIGVMPACDAPALRKLLAQAIDESPRAIQKSVKALKVTGVTDLDPAALYSDKRNCSADVLTNGGQIHLTFWVTWSDGKKDELLLRADDAGF
jgi:hypothetical protein